MSSKSPTVTQAQGAGTSIKQGSAWISARMSERGSSIAVPTQPSLWTLPGTIAVAQQVFSSDPKYKKYTQQVEKCLNSFDNVHEWADCIAFLKQLLKVQSLLHKEWKSILLPQHRHFSRTYNSRKFLASSSSPNACHNAWIRLCPQACIRGLWTSTHTSLECLAWVTRIRISCVNADDVSYRPRVWSATYPSGHLDYSLSSSTPLPQWRYIRDAILIFYHTDFSQPMLLDLYDTYYLPLQSALRPMMKSFILALLPGLEEETGEFFDKVGPTTTSDLQVGA